VYPAEDAYITAVGGTDLTTNGAGGSWASETAWSYSGGGISLDGIAIPSYQQLPGVPGTQGSTKYRNVPDVAAEANTDNYYCANGSCGTGLGGTSLAAPTWAGFMALVNQNRVANGESTVGFLNPTIYDFGIGGNYQSYFHDITSGNNGIYYAETGYDLVTGWGSPNGSGLITALTAIPPVGTLAWTTTTTRITEPCSGGSVTIWKYTAFNFSSSSGNQKLGGSAQYVINQNCPPLLGSFPPGATPAVLDLWAPTFTLGFIPEAGTGAVIYTGP
jgi:subtilase family serine protease